MDIKDFVPPSNGVLNDLTIFPKFPEIGPLAKYRKLASFDWKKLALIVDSEDAIKFKLKIWNFMENHPLFGYPVKELTKSETLHLATKRVYALFNERFFSFMDYIERPHVVLSSIIAITAYDPSLSIKFGLSYGMFPFVLRTMGTEKHEKILEDCENGKLFGAFALTEVAHGSNTFKMKTIATYDQNTKEFIIDTPNFEAAKCWPGNLGKTCTHIILFAQLYTGDGNHHGLNAFVIQIRDMKTLKPLPGITVGDLGEKIGLHGVDNGFLMFNKFRVPRDSLLSRLGEITDDGTFKSPIKDNKKRLGASFGSLSDGRVGIAGYTNFYLIQALTISLRYSAARLQFGPENSVEEFPVLEYQAQQYRLLPHLATAYVGKIFTNWLSLANINTMVRTFTGSDTSLRRAGMELHALSSAAKALCTWDARDGIQDCREACGGHGYLKVTGIGTLRNDNDGAITYEGENNVLIQQTSNWLLGIRKQGYGKFAEDASPLGSAAFLKDFSQIISTKLEISTITDAMNLQNIMLGLDWLCAWLLEQTGKRFDEIQAKDKSNFNAKNNTQVFYAATLAIVYAQRTMVYIFLKHLEKLPINPERMVLERLLTLYGLNVLIKHSGTLYMGGLFVSVPIAGEQLKLAVLELLGELKNDCIALIDSVAPTDFILNSPLGMSDGQVYKHLQAAIYNKAETFERPSWWQDIVNWKNYVTAKL